jgi:hypothetical protein
VETLPAFLLSNFDEAFNINSNVPHGTILVFEIKTD